METPKDQKIAQHKEFIETKARMYLKPLMIDILKEKPDDVLDYMIMWSNSKGVEIRKLHQKAEIKEPKVVPSSPKIEEIPKTQKSKKEIPEQSKEEPQDPKLPSEEPPKQEHFTEEQPSHEKQPSAENLISEVANKEVVSNNQISNQEPQNDEQTKLKENENYELPSSDEEEEIDEENDTKVQEKLEKQKNASKKKMGISAEAYGNYNQMKDFVAPFIEKSEDQIEQIKKTLGMSFMFKNLEQNDFDTVIGAMVVKNYNHGDHVIHQGDDGAELFIVGQGTLRCEKLFEGKDQPTFLKNYQVGDVFGELSLMYNAPRAASIISEQNSVCFSLDRDTFNNIVKGASMKKRNLFDDFLSRVEILSELEQYERSKICDCLLSETFIKGDFVIKEGEEGMKFYFVQEGTAEAVLNKEGEETKVFEYKENDYFGELALLNNEKRKASIRVTSDKMVVASLDKNSFKRLLGPIESILQRNIEKYDKYSNQISA